MANKNNQSDNDDLTVLSSQSKRAALFIAKIVRDERKISTFVI